MKTLLYKIFINHWPRKLVSIILAVIIWLVVNHTLTATRNISNVPVRIIHLPPGKTVEGMQASGRLAKRVTLTVVGNKALIDELTPSDLEIVVDAADKPDEWIVIVDKKNLVSLNPEIDLSGGITRVYHPNFAVRMTDLVTDQIPIVITQPIGEVPRGYQFLDVWPYRLTLTVTGPEEAIKRLKLKEQRITFNLNDISKAQLDELSLKSENSEVVNFFVPDQWKQIYIPVLSDTPINIDDPQAKALRIDFVRCNLLPVNASIPLSLFFPPEHLQIFNPENTSISPSQIVQVNRGVPLITLPLYANGVDNLFLQTVREMIEIVIIVEQKHDLPEPLDWSVQFVNLRQLEDKYVSKLMSDVSDREVRVLQPTLREEYLRNRFRSYMNHFQLFHPDETKFELSIRIKDHQIQVEEGIQVPTVIGHEIQR